MRQTGTTRRGRGSRRSPDRDAEDAGTFGHRVAALHPDAVIDMVCFTPESAAQLLDALRGSGAFLAMCGTMWVHGTPTAVPVLEHEDRTPWGDYGIRKTAIEDLVLTEVQRPYGVRRPSSIPVTSAGRGGP